MVSDPEGQTPFLPSDPQSDFHFVRCVIARSADSIKVGVGVPAEQHGFAVEVVFKPQRRPSLGFIDDAVFAVLCRIR